jgi:hypothetical protein
MTRRSKLWALAGGIYAFINVGGLAFAAAQGEEMHAMGHLFLLLVGLAGFVGWKLARRGMVQEQPPAQLGEARIEYLQQSIDAMALELERIGEKQRFSDKLRTEQGGAVPLKKLSDESKPT